MQQTLPVVMPITAGPELTFVLDYSKVTAVVVIHTGKEYGVPIDEANELLRRRLCATRYQIGPTLYLLNLEPEFIQPVIR